MAEPIRKGQIVSLYLRIARMTEVGKADAAEEYLGTLEGKQLTRLRDELVARLRRSRTTRR